MQKRMAVILLTLVLMIGLCSCGASDDPNLGLWKATTGSMLGMSMDVGDVFGEGFTIELKSGGKCTLMVDGDKASGKWTLDDANVFTVKGGGVDAEGTLKNGALILENVMGMGLTLTFEKEGGNPLAASGAAEPAAAKADVDYFVLTAITEGGETVSGADLAAYGLDGFYILLHKNGKAEVMLDPLVTGTWKNGEIDLGDMGVLEYTIKGNELAIELDGSALVYTRSKDAPPKSTDTSAPPEAVKADEDPLSAYSYPVYVEIFEGDWYGTLHFTSVEGTFAALEGTTIDILARFSFEDGEVIPFFAMPVDPDTAYLDFRDVTGDVNLGGIMIHGGYLLDAKFNDNVITRYANDTALLYLSGNQGDYSYECNMYLRPWGEAWSSSDRYQPRAEDLVIIASSTFEEIAELYGLSPSAYPAATDVSGKRSGQSSGGGGADSGTVIDGRLPAARLKEAWEAIDARDKSVLLTYEQFRDQFFGGIEATRIEEESDKMLYEWGAAEWNGKWDDIFIRLYIDKNDGKLRMTDTKGLGKLGEPLPDMNAASSIASTQSGGSERLSAAELTEAYQDIRDLGVSRLELTYEEMRDKYMGGIEANEIEDLGKEISYKWISSESENKSVKATFEKESGTNSSITSSNLN